MSSLISKSSQLARQCTKTMINSGNSSRNFFQGMDTNIRNKEALDKVCHNLLKARADPFHGHRKERLPDSEQKKMNASLRETRKAAGKVQAITEFLKFRMDNKY